MLYCRTLAKMRAVVDDDGEDLSSARTCEAVVAE